MDIRITEVLKELRRNKGNTQEELANHLNISVQAVSKWERAEGYPDISLLPKIAAFYDVTVDKLLGCDDIAKNEAISRFEDECHKIRNTGDVKSLLELCRKMQAEYPCEERVLYQLAYALMDNSYKENADEIIEIGQKLIKSENCEFRNSAIQILSLTYSAIGEKDLAKEYASMLPCNEDLLSLVLQGEELVEHCKWNYWRFADMLWMTTNRIVYCADSGYTAEEKHKLRETVEKVFNIIFSGGDFGFWHERLGRNTFAMARLSLEYGDNSQALKELEKAFYHFDMFEKFVSIDHTSLHVRGLHYAASSTARNYTGSLKDEYLEKLKEPCFDKLRNDKDFIAMANNA